MLKQRLKYMWAFVRQLSGDDAYERYVQHHSQHHPNEPLLNRRDFFIKCQEDKWSSIKRCC